MKLKVFNTLSGEKEEFIPREPPVVKMYACGPTTYNYIHLGNARPLVVFDTVRRYLEYWGYLVIYVQNFTDVDDKILKRAQEEEKEPLALAENYIQEYFRDAEALNVQKALLHPRVSENIEEIIVFIQGLLAKGYAYECAGDVFFEVAKFKEYGKLSGRSLSELRVGARLEVDPRKKEPFDFVLWKKAKADELAWDSPWGRGRPGWHIECSVMSTKYLGPSFDIHAGGLDLIFPHHENEIAQSEAFHGLPMAKYWLHNGFITIDQAKMSKSKGNFFLLREILKEFEPEVVRFYLLSTHYRRPLDFSQSKLEEAARAWERLKNTDDLLQEKLAEAEPQKGGEVYLAEISLWEKRFCEAMNDDFNTALALAVLFEASKTINGWLGELTNHLVLEKAARKYRQLAEILGLQFVQREAEKALWGELVELVIALRQEARERKDFAVADYLREKLQSLGIIVEDTPAGVRWKLDGK